MKRDAFKPLNSTGCWAPKPFCNWRLGAVVQKDPRPASGVWAVRAAKFTKNIKRQFDKQAIAPVEATAIRFAACRRI